MTKDAKEEPKTLVVDEHAKTYAVFQLVDALRDVAETYAAHAATSPAAGAWRKLASVCAELVGDDERADQLRAVPTPSTTYGEPPRFMPPGPEPTPGIPASARDDAKRKR